MKFMIPIYSVPEAPVDRIDFPFIHFPSTSKPGELGD